MKYGLIPEIKVPQNVKAERRNNGRTTPVFLTLDPGFFYDQYADDDLFRETVVQWEAQIRWTQSLEDALKARGIKYRKKKGCACAGGKLYLYFDHAVEFL